MLLGDPSVGIDMASGDLVLACVYLNVNASKFGCVRALVIYVVTKAGNPHCFHTAHPTFIFFKLGRCVQQQMQVGFRRRWACEVGQAQRSTTHLGRASAESMDERASRARDDNNTE